MDRLGSSSSTTSSSLCSGSLIPNTNAGGKIATIKNVESVDQKAMPLLVNSGRAQRLQPCGRRKHHRPDCLARLQKGMVCQHAFNRV